MREKLLGRAAADTRNLMKSQFGETEFILAYPDGIVYHYWTLARNYIIEKEINKTNLINPHILEIGCGRGIVVDYFRKRGYQYNGVDLGEVKPLASVTEYVLTGKDAFALSEGLRHTFGILCLLDVLEHLSHPVDFLGSLLEKYPNAAYLIITVPARNELWSNYDEFYHHLRRYDMNMLKDIIEAVNGDIREIRYFFHALYFPMRLTKLLSLNRPIKMNAPQNGMKILHYLISRLLILDYLLLPKTLSGTSLVCLMARKG